MNRRLFILFLVMTMVLFVTSCTIRSTKSSSISFEQKSVPLYSAKSSEYSLNQSSDTQIVITSLQDIQQESTDMDTTPGRLAISIIINKLDSATVVNDLSKQSAKDLFNILLQDAPLKSQTLEGLDQLYGLKSILASEGIFVNFQANNVVSTENKGSSLVWVDKFIKAINTTSSN